MKGTKIIVLQLREIFKSAIFAILGLALIILLICLFLPKNKNQEPSVSLYVPGTYTAEIVLHNKPVNVLVTVSEREIMRLELSNMTEAQEVFYPLFKPTLQAISKEIIDKQTTEISALSEYTYTSQILLNAINKALAKADIPVS